MYRSEQRTRTAFDERHLNNFTRRHYGALQGKDKQESVNKYGKEQVAIWRRSYGML